MAKRMLIDATHPEETRVVVVKGNRLEEFDFETSTKKPLKGNIYLAKVTRVEPALQAAFVEYGGNRHGFLAFSEIHPDYYQIPVADRQKLIELQAQEDALIEAEAERRAEAGEDADEDDGISNVEEVDTGDIEIEEIGGENAMPLAVETDAIAGPAAEPADPLAEIGEAPATAAAQPALDEPAAAPETHVAQEPGTAADTSDVIVFPPPGERDIEIVEGATALRDAEDNGDDAEEPREVTRKRRNVLRSYKIQEVIKRRQIMLVQVVKEERGNKGAALTTYLSLAGRFCVLMPNSSRGGGISRKIANPSDRKRLKSIVEELDVPQGMGVILRTAGLDRSKQEIKRDFDYLLRLWDSVRELTLKSEAPCLVYEEGDLIKRSIRDYYGNEIEEILIEGEQAVHQARDFMRLIMPSDVDRVRQYRDGQMRLFQRYQVEQQFDSMYSPTVSLKSGGYIVINPTEALVSIDVNSGKSTREHNIEETAYKTNLEAAEEIARQLRLRDLAGLIVIDFIDMEDSRNNRNVERRLKDCLKSDRARIQVGRISPFGLLEMSRQRLRPSILESSTKICPHCGGLGYIRSTESTALLVLRAIEEEAARERASELTVSVATSVALYILNLKRDALQSIESRYGVAVLFHGDDDLIPPAHKIERTRARQQQGAAPAAPRAVVSAESVQPLDMEEFVEGDATDETEAPETAETEAGGEDGDGRRRRRRRRRRKRRDEGDANGFEAREPGAGGEEIDVDGDEADGEDEANGDIETAAPEGLEEAGDGQPVDGAAGDDENGDRRRRRRGRRGGRRRRRERGDETGAENGAENGGATAMEMHDAGAAVADGEPMAADLSLVTPAPTRFDEPVAETSKHAPAEAVAGIGFETPTEAPAETIAPPPAAMAAPSAPAEAVAEQPAEPASEPSKPRRFGWWRRRGSE